MPTEFIEVHALSGDTIWIASHSITAVTFGSDTPDNYTTALLLGNNVAMQVAETRTEMRRLLADADIAIITQQQGDISNG